MASTILKKFNIRLDENQKWIALSFFLIGTISAYTGPTFIKEFGMKLPAQYFAASSMVTAFSALFVGMLWQGKLRDFFIKFFIGFALMESVAGFAIGMYLTFVEYNVWLLAISNLIYSNLIGQFVGKCIMTFRTKIWNDTDREIYDNNNAIIGSFVVLLGYGASLFWLPSIQTAVVIWGVSCLLDNIAWCCLYYKQRKLFL